MNEDTQAIAPGAGPVVPGALPSTAWQVGVGAAVTLAALLWAWGGLAMPADTPWRGGGARLVPAISAVGLLLCGAWLVWDGWRGGWAALAPLSGYAGLQLGPWVWVSTGVLLGGGALPWLGFVLAAGLGYALAVQGLRRAAQPQLRLSAPVLARDMGLGLLWAAVVYGLFTQLLQITLPTGALWI